ncbi:MAG: AAA family ATPase [Clostridia bacterium]
MSEENALAAEQEQTLQAVIDQIDRAVVGKAHVVKLLLTALITGGHVLLVDVPGVAKTRLARSLALSLNLSFARIQATPDLLPGDVVGVSVYDPATAGFRYRPGPVLNQVVLVDEVNRATPRTQSALLESMEEHQVTVDGVSHPIPSPFIVMATQNPIEMEGTYPLPEAQLDRFLFATPVGYPDAEDEMEMVRRLGQDEPLDRFEPVAGPGDVLRWRRAALQVHLSQPVQQYLVDIVRQTRTLPRIQLGASPRAALWYSRAVRVYAWLAGREYVLPDDVKSLATPILAHRMLLSADAEVLGRSRDEVVQEVLASVPAPTEQL